VTAATFASLVADAEAGDNITITNGYSTTGVTDWTITYP
jgi:hypothetical protein